MAVALKLKALFVWFRSRAKLLRTHPDDKRGDLETALSNLADLRSTLPELDGIVLAREARDDLERRSAVT